MGWGAGISRVIGGRPTSANGSRKNDFCFYRRPLEQGRIGANPNN
jgi:hypothetical protein